MHGREFFRLDMFCFIFGNLMGVVATDDVIGMSDVIEAGKPAVQHKGEQQ